MTIKFTQLMTYKIGDDSVSFTGREPFRVDDPQFEKALLSVGVFEKLEDGTMRYSGKVSVPMKDGNDALVETDGYVPCDKKDLHDAVKGVFL